MWVRVGGGWATQRRGAQEAVAVAAAEAELLVLLGVHQQQAADGALQDLPSHQGGRW